MLSFVWGCPSSYSEIQYMSDVFLYSTTTLLALGHGLVMLWSIVWEGSFFFFAVNSWQVRHHRFTDCFFHSYQFHRYLNMSAVGVSDCKASGNKVAVHIESIVALHSGLQPLSLAPTHFFQAEFFPLSSVYPWTLLPPSVTLVTCFLWQSPVLHCPLMLMFPASIITSASIYVSQMSLVICLLFACLFWHPCVSWVCCSCYLFLSLSASCYDYPFTYTCLFVHPSVN